jgi:hypothetical protein
MTNLFKSIWQGEIELCKLFWIYGVVAVILIPLVSPYLMLIIALIFPNISYTLYAYLFLFLYIPYGFVVIIGIWRSADNYQGPKKWAICAKLITITFAIFLFYNLLTFRHQLEIIKQFE